MRYEFLYSWLFIKNQGGSETFKHIIDTPAYAGALFIWRFVLRDKTYRLELTKKMIIQNEQTAGLLYMCTI